MAEDWELLEFVIRDAYTPRTLPMARLAEYLADLAALLGEKDHVHFVALKGSSSNIVHAVDREATEKVRARAKAAPFADGDPDARRAYGAIDDRLREDGATGELRRQDDEGGRLLYFPGKDRQVDEEYGPFNEQGQFYGVPIAVGGKRSIVPVQLQDGEMIHRCEASRDVALQIAPYLFNHHVRAYGIGRHFRNAKGAWEMNLFRISHVEKLDARPLAETVERLRGITRKVGLDRDIIQKLADLRHEPSKA